MPRTDSSELRCPMPNGSTVGARVRGGPCRVARLGRVVAISTLAACRDAAPLTDLPVPHDRLGAVLVLHTAECDSHLAAFGVFNRDEVRRAVPLVGVVALDSAPDRARIRSSLAAFDFDAPLLDVSAATRERLRAAVRDVGMTIVLVRRAVPVTTLSPIGTPGGEREFARTVLALAADQPSR